MLTFREYKRMKLEVDPGAVFIDDSVPYLNFNTEEANLLNNNNVNGDEAYDTNQDINTKYSSTKFSINLDLDQPENHYNVSIEWLGRANILLEAMTTIFSNNLDKDCLELEMGELLWTPKCLVVPPV